MVGLVDIEIVPTLQTVKFRGHDLGVCGISVETIAKLFMRYPEVKKVLESGAADVAASLLKMSDDVVVALIAAGLGVFGDKTQEQKIASMALGEKAAILAAIVKLTMPDGLGPFVDLLTALGLATPAVPVAKPGVIKLRAFKSPQQLSA